MQVYDVECYPNVFLLSARHLDDAKTMTTFEISFRRDDRHALYEYFCWCQVNKIDMIGFNNLHYDYPMIHYIFHNIHSLTYQSIYEKNQSIFASQNRFGETIAERDRFAPQIDLYKMHHFDNEAKRTSLKALEINMRSDSVQDLPFEPGTALSAEQIDLTLVPYNRHDVNKTAEFAAFSAKMIKLRRDLASKINGDIVNFNDTKIGKEMLAQRLGSICWQYDGNGRKQPRQTWREFIDLNAIIFPYIQFKTPEFNRVLQWLKSQKISETKGIFEGVSAFVGGLFFNFGTGGIHGSVTRQAFASDAHYRIIDIDVESLYPSIAIVNRLAPQHLGTQFIDEYSALKAERVKHAKGTAENAALKLALNGTYGDSNSKFSVFYDPAFTMAITINGQLLLCMLAEWLMTVPTLQIIQINTDGITFKIHRGFEGVAKKICDDWQAFSLLKLETAYYSRMFIRDVNNYVAETEDTGKLKTKGAYFAPKNAQDIQDQSPPAWHKDFSNLVSIRAAVAHMINGTPVESFIRAHRDPFDFLIRYKVKRDCEVRFSGVAIQRTGRYFVSVNGGELIKSTPIKRPFKEGDFKKTTIAAS